MMNLTRIPEFKPLNHTEFAHRAQSRLAEYIATPIGEIPSPIDVFRLFSDSTAKETLRTNGAKTSDNL